MDTTGSLRGETPQFAPHGPELAGNVSRVQRFSTHDGPGIRTTVFFKGCPLSCPWCHNPETIRLPAELMFFEERCRSCGACVAVCPEGAHLLTAEGRHRFERSLCTGRYACVEACPFGALESSLKITSVAQVMETVLKDAPFYRRSGGGLTLSGGEPLLQPQFAGALLGQARRSGVHTAVDTCLYAPWAVVESLVPVVDLWLVDLKLIDPQRHEGWTGVANESILENLRKLASLPSAELWIRVPLVEGVNSDTENLEATVALIEGLEHVDRIELLAYHGLGEDKRRSLGESSPRRFECPQAEVLRGLARALRERGLPVKQEE